MDNSETAVQRLLSVSSALRNFHDVKGSFDDSIVPALNLKAHVLIKIMYSNLFETTSL